MSDAALAARRRALAALAVLTPAFAAAGHAPAPAAGAACPPPPAPSPAAGLAPGSPSTATPAPGQPLVCVGAQAITGATYLHWLAIANRAQSPSSNAQELRGEVLAFLISADWLTGEAAALKIHLSAAAVRRSFYHLRGQAFPRHREFRAFLRQTGETVADLLFRVKLNLLSQRLQKRVLAGHRGSRSQQLALARWVASFKSKWRAHTYCAAEYVVSDCGHVQSAL